MPDRPPTVGQYRWTLAARVAGPVVFAATVLGAPADLARPARLALGVGLWMVVWWIGETLPLAATSLLPIVLFPLLGVTTTREAAAPYANEIVFLFLAGFLLAAALEHWDSHTRIALSLILGIGASGRRVVLGVMLATGFISMWISNTATAAMMYPIAIAIGRLFGEGAAANRTRVALMLGVAYAASLGGMGTLIGTPPNLILAGAAQQLTGRTVSFGQFMALGVPLVAILLPLCWALLVFGLFPSRAELGPEAVTQIRNRRAKLGPLHPTTGEARALLVFSLTALAWILRERKDFGSFTLPGLVDLVPNLSDASVGMFGAILLFVVTGRTRDGERRPLLTWGEARRIPWDVLLLFGGGLSLAAALESTGVTTWLGARMSGLVGAPVPLIYLGLALAVLALSELASNTAVAAMTMPLAAALGHAVGQPPIVLMVVAAFAASCGFALPVATPPNAIVFGSGQVTVRQMGTAGLLLDVLAVGVIVAGLYLLVPVVLR